MDDSAFGLDAQQHLAPVMRYDRRAIRRLAQGIAELRGISPTLNIQAIHIFLEVAVQQGITVSELVRKTGLSQASCSRNLALLSEMHRLGKPGLELVVSFEDPVDRRRKIVELTPRGAELAAVLGDIAR